MYRDTISDAFEDLLGIDLIWEESVAELDTFLTSLYAPK